MERNEILAAILRKQPKIHCLTNPVTMNDVANILLAAGGSAVMAQDEQEAAEITTFCQGTLLNTGVPDEAKIRACILAGKRAEGKHNNAADSRAAPKLARRESMGSARVS